VPEHAWALLGAAGGHGVLGTAARGVCRHPLHRPCGHGLSIGWVPVAAQRTVCST